MSRKLQILRGASANIPTLSDGEFGYCTDTNQLFIGNNEVNKEIATKEQLDNISTYVTPQMFGAKGDGIIDDTEAIQNAINHCSNVKIDDGIFAFKELILKDNLKLYGNGTLLYIGTPSEKDRAYYPIHTSLDTGNKNIEICGITFDGNINNRIYDDTVFAVCDTLTLIGSNIKVHDCTFVNNVDSGIMFSCCKNSAIYNNYIDYASDSGIYVNANDNDNGMDNFLIHDNIIKNTRAAGIALKRITSYGIVANNIISDCGGGITFEHASSATDFSKQCDVVGNYIRNVGDIGILIRGGYSQNVNSNRIEKCKKPIVIDSSKYINCCDNILYECNNSTDGMLLLTVRNKDYPCEHINIANNIIKGNTYGVFVWSSISGASFNDISISGNNIDTVSSGVKIIDGFVISRMNIINNNASEFELCNDNVEEILVKDNIVNQLIRNTITMIDREISYGNFIRRTYITNNIGLAENFTFNKYDKVKFTDNYNGEYLYLATSDGMGSSVLTQKITFL